MTFDEWLNGRHEGTFNDCNHPLTPGERVAAYLAWNAALSSRVLAESDKSAGQHSDTALLDWLRDGCCDLRCINVPSAGGDDADVRWIVVEHHMAKPHEREIGRSFTDDPRDAIRAAIKQEKGDE